MIEHQLDYMLNPNHKNFSATVKSELTAKDQYKKTTERNTIFELEQ
jgi:hypothetical protein